jgi:hypothetical protein
MQYNIIIFNNTKRRSRDNEESPWEKFTGERPKLDQHDTHPLFCPVYILNHRLQEGGSNLKLYRRAEQKVYVGHLHHYLRRYH